MNKRIIEIAALATVLSAFGAVLWWSFSVQSRLSALEKAVDRIEMRPPEETVERPTSNPCSTARLAAYPSRVPKNRTVDWIPADCQMVVQSYKDDALIGVYRGSASGEITFDQLTAGRTGYMEIKIWVEGERTPANAKWVTVVD